MADLDDILKFVIVARLQKLISRSRDTSSLITTKIPSNLHQTSDFAFFGGPRYPSHRSTADTNRVA
jgi:hypothetical protein